MWRTLPLLKQGIVIRARPINPTKWVISEGTSFCVILTVYYMFVWQGYEYIKYRSVRSF